MKKQTNFPLFNLPQTPEILAALWLRNEVYSVTDWETVIHGGCDIDQDENLIIDVYKTDDDIFTINLEKAIEDEDGDRTWVTLKTHIVQFTDTIESLMPILQVVNEFVEAGGSWEDIYAAQNVSN